MMSPDDNGDGDGYEYDDGDDAIISFGGVDDDDDDDMADLFSFGAAAAASSSSSSPSKAADYSAAMASVMPLPKPIVQQSDDDDESSSSSSSEDSFMELLEQNKEEITIVDAAAVKLRKNNNNNNDNPDGEGGGDGDGGDGEGEMDEKDMQEILNWLDTDDDDDDINLEEELLFVEPPRPPTLEESLQKSKQQQQQTTPTPPPQPEFDTLEQAVKSPKATIHQIRLLLEKENFVVTASVRPHLWCRVFCGKTLDETLQSSVADSFQEWEKLWQLDQQQQQNRQQQQHSSKRRRQFSIRKSQLAWIQRESATLAERISTVLKSDKELCQRALSVILINHYCTVHKGSMDDDDDDDNNDDDNDDDDNNDNKDKDKDANYNKDDKDDKDNEDNKDKDENNKNSTEKKKGKDEFMDVLLPPVASALLSAGIPKVGAAVMLTQIVPHYMPILALTTKERTKAASTLHQQFYLLACYHLPLLAIHLDRNIPDWYQWPPNGFLPQSYLISHLAGECGKQAELNPRGLLCLWDLILTSSNNSLRFFLVMAILEQHADQLILLTGDALKDELQRVLTFQNYSTQDGFEIEEVNDQTSSTQAVRWVQDWTEKAQTLWEHTPKSVVRMLKHIEDAAVKDALAKRQRDAEERLKLKLEAQARAHQEAIEAEQERKADAARLRLTRARLVAFYRQYNPGKENNIDKIMTTYEGRYDVLDAKLKKKYGVSFNPAMKPKQAPKNTSNNPKLLPFSVRRGQNEDSKQQQQQQREDPPDPKKPRDMAVQIQASELVPSICWSKEANKANLLKLRKQSSKLAQPEEMKLPLKFYLVDCRPEESVLDQGRFPTSVSLSPEILLDADRMKQMDDMFEGLRGTVHICIMGEGYSALPELYGHKITRGLLEFIKEDEARVMNCVLFFLKKGYPFVSVLNGGFATAHAFLSRKGPEVHLKAQNVLTDYNPGVSIFGQFENAHNASGREKAQRTLQGLFDSGMTALTKNTLRFESLASETGTAAPATEEEQQPQKTASNVVSRFWGTGDSSKKEDPTKSGNGKSESKGTTPPTAFLNPFARKAQGTNNNDQKSLNKPESKETLEVESVDFDNPESGQEARSNEAGAKDSVESEKEAQHQSHGSAEPVKSNPFSGLGAALNNSLKASTASSATSAPASQSARPRNPFARFGMGNNNNQNAKKTEAAGSGVKNNFAGFGQLRINTVARMIGGAGGAASNDSAASNKPGKLPDEPGEETVSLGPTSPSISSSSGVEESVSPPDDVATATPSAGEASNNNDDHAVDETDASTKQGDAATAEIADDETPKQKANIAQV